MVMVARFYDSRCRFTLVINKVIIQTSMISHLSLLHPSQCNSDGHVANVSLSHHFDDHVVIANERLATVTRLCSGRNRR